ncbi:hypothetical protein B0H12DRAFT_1138095 [Mycena haematopus]|nr:hypothetical protein B0H12DRAFT_1138095 [Mycena haematopus]
MMPMSRQRRFVWADHRTKMTYIRLSRCLSTLTLPPPPSPSMDNGTQAKLQLAEESTAGR